MKYELSAGNFAPQHLKGQEAVCGVWVSPALDMLATLQEAVVQWMGEQNMARDKAAAELVVDLAVAGLFCPSAYLVTLLGRVSMPRGVTDCYVTDKQWAECIQSASLSSLCCAAGDVGGLL
jgi:hypothetical protein